jgi:hypothetical protein
MGAALTYARRYALFTLVGIAGEDDRDAPDLNLKIEPVSREIAVANAFATDRQAQSLVSDEVARAASIRREATARSAKTTLDPDRSAALRERLIADLAGLRSEDEAADWAHKNLQAKNTLTTDDADLVEASFREKLSAIAMESVVNEVLLIEIPPENAMAPHLSAESEDPFLGSADASARVVNAKVPRRRMTTKVIRLRDKEHCKFVTAQPCVICGRTPSEAHHLRFAQPRALGRKVSDEYTVPVCRIIANSIATEMKPHGGRASMSTPCRSLLTFGDVRGRLRIKCRSPTGALRHQSTAGSVDLGFFGPVGRSATKSVPSTWRPSSDRPHSAWRAPSGSLDYAVSLDGPPCMSELPAGTRPARLNVEASPRPPGARKPETELGAASTIAVPHPDSRSTWGGRFF